MKKISLLMFFATVALVGCKDGNPVQTAEWYKANAPERAEMRTKCKANPGELAGSANCVNADRAESMADGEKRGGLNVEPMGDVKLRGNR